MNPCSLAPEIFVLNHYSVPPCRAKQNRKGGQRWNSFYRCSDFKRKPVQNCKLQSFRSQTYSSINLFTYNYSLNNYSLIQQIFIVSPWARCSSGHRGFHVKHIKLLFSWSIFFPIGLATFKHTLWSTYLLSLLITVCLLLTECKFHENINCGVFLMRKTIPRAVLGTL